MNGKPRFLANHWLRGGLPFPLIQLTVSIGVAGYVHHSLTQDEAFRAANISGAGEKALRPCYSLTPCVGMRLLASKTRNIG